MVIVMDPVVGSNPADDEKATETQLVLDVMMMGGGLGARGARRARVVQDI
jgi:hypothetical protein